MANHVIIPELTYQQKNKIYGMILQGSDCWPWIGRTTHDGYGQIQIGKSTYLVHRLQYYIYTEIDPGELLVCHTCDNPRCCNPNHLFLGTDADNNRDCLNKGRHKCLRGEIHLDAKLSDLEIQEIRNSMLTQKELAEKYGVTQPHISRIKRRLVRNG